MNILIAGGTGFVGSNIVNSLCKNYNFFLITRKKIKKKGKNTNIKYIYFKNYFDLNKKLKKIKADIVIHSATHYVKEHKFEDIAKLSDANILFGNIILENLKSMKVKKIIYFSTVWEDYNGIKDNTINLYSAYKKSFSYILKYYQKLNKNIKFYYLMLSDTFGLNDKRNKIINILKENYKKNKLTKITSKNLNLNLLNVEDLVSAIEIIIKQNIKPNKYVLKNNYDYKIFDIIKAFNKINFKKIKINWLSNKRIKHKIFNYKKLKSWKVNKSNIHDLIKIIKYEKNFLR